MLFRYIALPSLFHSIRHGRLILLVSCRCQTCTQSFCEDCLPEGELDAIGDVLPELYVLALILSLLNADLLIDNLLRASALLGYGEKTAAYYIRCQDCHEHFAEHPEAWASWEEEMRETNRRLEEAEARQNAEQG
jgi:SWI/SNF-related matrix-associated actin-dependent regulator of chromatin subfamily A member 5